MSYASKDELRNYRSTKCCPASNPGGSPHSNFAKDADAEIRMQKHEQLTLDLFFGLSYLGCFFCHFFRLEKSFFWMALFFGGWALPYVGLATRAVT